jgi:hypothetical protein
MKEKTYSCALCNLERTLQPGEPVPDCCGQPMTLKLEQCTRPFVAETARPDSAAEPCDDGIDASQ